jgi:UDP-N-acetylmuramate dehydrogenase
LISVPPTFAELTTMHVGGPTREFAVATGTDQLVELVQAADASGVPLLIIGGAPTWSSVTPAGPG